MVRPPTLSHVLTYCVTDFHYCMFIYQADAEDQNDVGIHQCTREDPRPGHVKTWPWMVGKCVPSIKQSNECVHAPNVQITIEALSTNSDKNKVHTDNRHMISSLEPCVSECVYTALTYVHVTQLNLPQLNLLIWLQVTHQHRLLVHLWQYIDRRCHASLLKPAV